MSPTLSEAIRQDFPHLTVDYDNPASSMSEGFAIADGWEQLFRQLLAEIEAERLKLPPEEAAKVKLAQVKEKWAGLRVYVEHANSPIRDVLDRAEQLSFNVCEACGATGEGVHPCGGGWIKTLCPTCRGE
jgi:hypothetical protein